MSLICGWGPLKWYPTGTSTQYPASRLHDLPVALVPGAQQYAWLRMFQQPGASEQIVCGGRTGDISHMLCSLFFPPGNHSARQLLVHSQQHARRLSIEVVKIISIHIHTGDTNSTVSIVYGCLVKRGLDSPSKRTSDVHYTCTFSGEVLLVFRSYDLRKTARGTSQRP